MPAEALTLAAAAAAATAALVGRPVGYRDSWVRFRGDPVDPAPVEVAVGCAEEVAVADTLRARGGPAAVRDDFDEDAAAAAVAVAAAAALKADDGTTEVAPSNYFGYFAADDTDDDPGATAAADEPSSLRTGSAAAAAAPTVEADSGPGQSLASGCFAEVVPCFAADVDGVVVAGAVADTVPAADAAVAAGDDDAAEDGDCHPSEAHQDPCPAAASAAAGVGDAVAAPSEDRPAVTVQSPAAVRSAVESASGPSHPVHSSTASPTFRCPCCACQEPSAVGAFPGPSSSPLYSWCSLAV